MPFVPASSRSASGAGVPLLASATLGVAASSLTVSSIPQTATNLMVMLHNLASTAAALTDTATIRINGDSGASHYGAGPAASNVNSGFSNAFVFTITAATQNAPGSAIFYLMNYTNAIALSIQCIFLTSGRFGNAGTNADFSQGSSNGAWGVGSAVTSLTVAPVTGPNLIAGCTMNVYGF